MTSSKWLLAQYSSVKFNMWTSVALSYFRLTKSSTFSHIKEQHSVHFIHLKEFIPFRYTLTKVFIVRLDYEGHGFHVPNRRIHIVITEWPTGIDYRVFELWWFFFDLISGMSEVSDRFSWCPFFPPINLMEICLGGLDSSTYKAEMSLFELRTILYYGVY